MMTMTMTMTTLMTMMMKINMIRSVEQSHYSRGLRQGRRQDHHHPPDYHHHDHDVNGADNVADDAIANGDLDYNEDDDEE